MTRFDKLMGSVGKAKQPEQAADNKDSISDPLPSAETISVESKAKSSSKDYQRTTVYLPRELHKRFKVAALNEGKEMSEVVTELIETWLGNHKKV